jgi:hypothetical protein
MYIIEKRRNKRLEMKKNFYFLNNIEKITTKKKKKNIT